MSRESDPASPSSRPPANQRGTHGADLVLAALDFLRGGIPADVRPCGPPTLARQKKDLRQWTDRLGLLLSSSDLPAKVVRGGQEHELFHDEVTDRYFKVTRNGVFGLSPGIELALVSSAQDARRFHLWEASPLEYLERLHLQNLLDWKTLMIFHRLDSCFSQYVHHWIQLFGLLDSHQNVFVHHFCCSDCLLGVSESYHQS